METLIRLFNGKQGKNQQSKEIKKKDQEPSRNNNNKKYE